MRRAVHVGLFVVAGAVFFVGLNVGLQHDPDLGTLLWVVAAAIAVLNAVWMSRSGG